MCESGIQKRLAHLEGLNGLCPLRPWTTALRARFALPTGCATVSALRALLVFSKLNFRKEKLKKAPQGREAGRGLRRWSTRSVVHGRRLGCFAVQGVGKAGTRRAVPALVVGAAALSMPGTGHRARRWNTKEKRPFRAAGVVQGLQPLFQAIIECHVLGNRIDALSHQRQRSAFGHQRAIKANG